ncbi:MAG: CRISPR-associated helicase Cas3' [Pseudomonadota bacterium]
MTRVLANIWAKTDKGDGKQWHPLILHMLDVAASADAILSREPESTQMRMAACLGMNWEDARSWILPVIACHDLGKACPGFQCKWPEAPETGLQLPPSPNTKINHAFVSQIALMEFLQEHRWPDELATLVADAVGCHHGERASQRAIDYLAGDRRAVGSDAWSQARRGLAEALLEVFKPRKIPNKPDLSGPDFMLISGLTSFADWIGSNENWFSFGTSEDCGDLQGWFNKRKVCSENALDAIGWEPRSPLSTESRSFKKVFGFIPRPLQQAVSDALDNVVKEPSILLIEAPMGEGKTEAAFFAHLELQRRFGHRGLYVAMPSKATGNAMFNRTLNFLRGQGSKRKLDLQLLHGAALLSDAFQNVRLSGIYDSTTEGEIRAGEWFTHKKRALLSEYGVGTVDQALLPILPVRHNFVRLWGLANRVVVFDEIHAYDAYTGTLLVHLLRWLLALGSSIVLLSATLPPSIRRKLASVVGAASPEQETKYPRLSVFQNSSMHQDHFEADPTRRRTLRLRRIGSDLVSMHSVLDQQLADRGMGLALVNTVQRAQDLYRLFPEGELLVRKGQRVGKRLSDGTEVFLFHARFPAELRQVREDQALETFGPKGNRTGRKILIATQVAEQSLDLDFDFIITDLAPIDLLLQRAGRLWRHTQGFRAVSEPILAVAGLEGDEPPLFGKPLWWGSVYREDLLLRTWCLIRNRRDLTLPDDIDILVQAVYEEQVDVPDSLQERMEKALESGDGEAITYRGQANQAIIGLPDDASWNDPARFILYDEDEPGLHRTLMAQTRLGKDSVMAIPVWPNDGFYSEEVPDFAQARQWFLRSISFSRESAVRKLQSLGVPEGWKQSPLLRNCFPLVLDAERRWINDALVRLDDDLGLVYESKEAE